MMRPCVAWIVCLFAVPLVNAAPLADKGGGLRYQFKEGEKIRYVIEEKALMEIDVAGIKTKIGGTTVVDLTWQVAKVGKDGKVTLKQTVDRLRLNGSGPTGNMAYDSKLEKAPDDDLSKRLAETLQVFAGADMTLTIDRLGHIESLKYSEKLAAAIAKLPPASAGMMAALSEDSIRRMVGQCMPVLPEKAPAKGASWGSRLKAKLTGGVNFTLDNKLTYEGPVKLDGRSVEKIVNKPTLAVVADAGAAMIKLQSQEVTGTAYFSKVTGRLIDSAYEQKIEFKVTENEMTVTLKGNTRTTLKLVEKEK